MTNDEALALAKKCGAYCDVGYVGAGEVLFQPNGLLAFAAALEEKHQEQIARLRAAVSIAIERSMNFRPVVGKEFAQLEQALSATQQSSDAFLAEVRAKALIDAATELHSQSFRNEDAVEELQRMASELRASAAQPEGKEGGE